MSIIDTVYAYKFVKHLSMPWTKYDAFRLGIIDENGVLLKPYSTLTTEEEKDAYNPFIRLVMNVKRMVEKLPGGSSKLVNYSAALYLIKEDTTMTKSISAGKLKTIIDILEKGSINEEPTNVIGNAGANPNIATRDPVMKFRKTDDDDEDDLEDDEKPVKEEFDPNNPILSILGSEFNDEFPITGVQVGDMEYPYVRDRDDGDMYVTNMEYQDEFGGLPPASGDDDSANERLEFGFVVNKPIGMDRSETVYLYGTGPSPVIIGIIHDKEDHFEIEHKGIFAKMKNIMVKTIESGKAHFRDLLTLRETKIDEIESSLLSEPERKANQQAARAAIAAKHQDDEKADDEEEIKESRFDLIKETMTRRKKRDAHGVVHKFYKRDQACPPGQQKTRDGGCEKIAGERSMQQVKKTKIITQRKRKKTLKKKSSGFWRMAKMRREKTMKA